MGHRFLGSLGRRDILKGLTLAGGAVALNGRAAAEPARASDTGDPARPELDPVPAGRDVLALFGDLTPGSQVGPCRLEAVHGTKLGAVAVVLADHAGARFQVDIHRRDDAEGGLNGIAHTPSLTLSLTNRGDGSTATREEHGLGVMALADALSQREAAGASVPRLLTLRERTSRFANATMRVIA